MEEEVKNTQLKKLKDRIPYDEDIFESDLWLKCHDIYFDEKLDKDFRKEKAQQFYLDHKEKMKFPVLWKEKWDCFNDLAIPYWENRKAFMSELMNDASSIGEKWFKGIRTMSSDEIESHDFIKTMLIAYKVKFIDKSKKEIYIEVKDYIGGEIE